MLRLMCITAHPDDEAGGFGGSLLLYSERGVETCVICLTPGQAASHRGEARTAEELAEMRRKEFLASCKILKVSRPIILDYPDGQLYRQELYSVVRELVKHIRHIRPHVIMTFGPEGGVTGHPDHSMASIFATMAFHWAGRKSLYPDLLAAGLEPYCPQKLYYASANFSIPDREPISLSPISTTVEIGNYYETKVEAFKAHTTQAPLWKLFESHTRPRGTHEMFHLAASVKSGPVVTETDLFTGVQE